MGNGNVKTANGRRNGIDNLGETDKDINSADSNWVADFETTTDENDCRVWLWGLCNVSDVDDWSYDTDIESFMDRMSCHDKHHIYFHNLAFDGAFILDWLLNNGFIHHQGRTKKPLTFTTLISKMAKFYSITVIFDNGAKVEFRDSLKKLPMSVANVAKAFKLDEGKGEIDYHLPRPVGYIPTGIELDYLRRDVQIVAHALHVQFVAGMKRLTVGADSLAEYKHTIGAKYFTRAFPILCPTMDDDVRRAYRGGFAIVAERFKGVRVGRGRVYDINSLYPSVMYDRLLPYGEPCWFNGAPKVSEDYPLFVVCLTLTAKLKPDHVPCIQIKGSPHFAATVYQSDITEPTTLTCTSVDLALWHDHYDLDILSWNGGWKFHAVAGFFKEYIDKWMKVKENSTGGLRFIAKLHLNALYGKFATNPDVTPKVPILDRRIVKPQIDMGWLDVWESGSSIGYNDKDVHKGARVAYNTYVAAQEDAATTATNGYMVSAAGLAKGYNGGDFFNPDGRYRIGKRYMTDELKSWFGDSDSPQETTGGGLLTFKQYQALSKAQKPEPEPLVFETVVRLVIGDEETRNPVYTPVGVFITAYARDVTIRAAQKHYDVFAYADTDSLHLLVDDDPPDLDVHPTRLGAWKYEGAFSEAIFVRAKCYSEHMVDGTYSTHVAGLPESIASRVTLDDMIDGAVWSGKLSPHRVPGGIVLRSVNFTLNMK